MARALEVALAAVLLVGVASTVPAQEALPPLRDTLSLSEGGWVAWRVHAPEGSRIAGAVDTTLEEAVMAAGAVWMRPVALPDLRTAAITAWKGESKLVVQRHGLPPVNVQLGGGPSAPLSIQEEARATSDGEWLVVALATADGPHQGAARLYADEDASILGRQTGRGFVHRLDGFQGEVLWAKSAATLRSTKDAHVVEAGQGALVAAFFGGVDAADLTIRAPHRSWSGQRDYMIWSDEPGDHRFSLRDGTHVSEPCVDSVPGPLTCGVPDVRLFGAAITVP